MNEKFRIIKLAVMTKKNPFFLYNHFLYFKEEFNVDIMEYLNRELYREDNQNAYIEIISRKISVLKNITVARAVFKIKQINELLNITPVEYYENKWYDYTNYWLISGIINKPSEECVIDRMTDIISMRMGILKSQAENRIKYISNKYNVTYKTIMFQCFYKCTDRQIREKLDSISGSYEGSIVGGLRFIANRENVTLSRAEERIKELGDKFGIDVFFNRKYFKMNNDKIFQIMDAMDEEYMNQLIKTAERNNMSVKDFCYSRKLDTLAFGISKETYNGLNLAGKSKENLNSFIIDSDMRYLMTKYNISDKKEILDDKIKFANYFIDMYGRKFWDNSKGSDYNSFQRFLQELCSDEIIIKPVGGLAGKGIRKYNIKSMSYKELYYTIEEMGNVIVEECIKQHKDLAAFGSGAVNTMRIVTIYENNQCNIIYALFRVGTRNDIVDNFSRGGLYITCKFRNGRIGK